MFRLRCWKFCALVWAAAALFSVGLGAIGSWAQPIVPITTSAWGFVTVLKTHATGEEVLSVTMDAALAGCDSETVYATNYDDNARKLHHALLLGAFLNHKHVSITTQGCISDAHRILAVAVRDDQLDGQAAQEIRNYWYAKWVPPPSPAVVSFWRHGRTKCSCSAWANSFLFS